MKLVVVLGTRPEIIKTSALLRLLEKRAQPYRLIHTGQHFSFGMDRIFFEDLGLPKPHHRLDPKKWRKGNPAEQVSGMSQAIEKILVKEKPCAVLVQGDTNSVLAGALAAIKTPGVLLGHIEAGLRSRDLAMPEEVNRIITDHAADALFAPTTGTRKTLLKEGVDPKKIFVTGNTIVDAVLQARPLARKKVDLSSWLGLQKNFFLLTLHRQENVDSKTVLRSILRGVELVYQHWKRPIVFPIHPRTSQKLKQFGLKLPQGVHAIDPVGFLPFLRFEESAELILTDSGGVQEEACILGVPCVTLRTSTERPETVQVGANRIAGFQPEKILLASGVMIKRRGGWKNPFGDGKSSERIVEIMERGFKA